MVKGVGVSPGISIGKAFLLDRRKVKVERFTISSSMVESEISRFMEALEKSRAQLSQVKEKLVQNLGDQGHSRIVDVHILILEDETLINEAIKIVKEERVNAEWALRKVLTYFAKVFDQIEDPYMKERRSDIEHVGQLILRNLVGEQIKNLDEYNHNSVYTDNSSCQIKEYNMNNVIITADMKNPGFLILTDTYYPGWKVYVDGVEKEILIADYLFRSVFLEKGSHKVEFIYDPLSFKIGLWITCITLISMLSIYLIRSRTQ